ncbi:MAG: dipeptidase [Ostreibacterium sp.]
MLEKVIWDAHSCVPLSKNTDLSCLLAHQKSGVNYVSINVGMDMNPLTQVIEIIASFRKQIKQSDSFTLGNSIEKVNQAIADNKLSISFDIEGAMCCQGNPDMVYLLHDLGVKQIHFAYNRNNELGGGCHDVPKKLTTLGKAFVDAINDCGLLMDVSHTGYQTSMDIFEYSDQPVIYSHANPYALVKHGRNIRDEQIDACVATGGIVCANGVGRFLGANDLNIATLAEHIDYLVQRVGADKVGIGLDYCYNAGQDDMPSDLDKNHWWPKDAGYENGLSMKYISPNAFITLPKVLAGKGYSQLAIDNILGGNMYRLAHRVWKSL